MLKLIKDYPLKDANAFKLNVKTKYFTEITNVDELKNLIKTRKFRGEKHYILGQGWNTLFTKDFNGLVIKIAIKSRCIISENKNRVILELGAGEDWIKIVKWAVKNNWGSIENLSLIPGTVGAAPVHNIAAYGQNFDEVFVSLDAIDLETGQSKTFTKAECRFGYRTSVFKRKLKSEYIITRVRIRLSKEIHIDTSYHSRYGSLESELVKFAQPPYTISDVARAVTNIRRAKFPDWTKVGTAGSFFLNPVITKKKLAELQKIIPNVQYYPVDKLTYPKPDDPMFDHSRYVKVAAGWLLEELGWRGKRIGSVGTSPNQSLVVINYGSKNAQEILNFTHNMKKGFEKAYKIKLEPEINIV